MVRVLSGVCALAVLLLALAWWRRRSAASGAHPDAPVFPWRALGANPTAHARLRDELCRQDVAPYGQNGPAVLLPVLAWQLYPKNARTLYDRSRDLDLGLVGLLDEGVDVRELHTVLRDVRRQLLLERMRGGRMRGAILRAQSARLEQVSRAIFAFAG